MTTCHIVGAGENSPDIIPQKQAGDLLIAADAGLLFLRSIGLVPDLFVGDGDSLGALPDDLPCAVLPRVKDDTDMLAAVRIGLDKGYRRFLLYGALGGNRFSHSIANLQTLSFLAEHGAEGAIVAPRATITLLEKGDHTYDFTGGFFSLFSLETGAEVSVTGARYPLSHTALTPAFPLGVSNEGSQNTRITIHHGKVLLVREKDR